MQGDGSWTSVDDRFGLAGGFVWRPLVRWAAGGEGKAIDVGAVGNWNVAPDQRVRAFASLYRRRYDGDYAFLPTDGAVPPDPRKHWSYVPPERPMM